MRLLITQIGFGTGTTWFKQDGKGPLNRDLIQVLKTAISSGFTHIDTAEAYGTEEEVGIAIKESNIPRHKLFVTTKVLDSIGDIESAIKNSLHKLQLDYVDMYGLPKSPPFCRLMEGKTDLTIARYMIHTPYWTTDESKLQDAWKKMEGVHRSGKAKAIGVSNYLRPHVEATLAVASIVPAVNQIEFHPYLQRSDDYIPWLRSKGIQVSAFKPLTPVASAAGGPLDVVVERISKRHGVSVNSVLLRWQVQKKVVPITTTERENRLNEYMEATRFELSEEEIAEISSVGLTHHFRNWGKDFFAPDDRT